MCQSNENMFQFLTILFSDDMKARLMREASTGLDADKPQTNVILYISVAVAILVALGGQGILY